MDQATISFIEGVVLFVVGAGTWMSVYWVRHRVRSQGAPDWERLVEQLREEQDRLHSESRSRIAELEERLDFAERRLVQEREAPRLPTSRPLTPV
jgi:hypothetical protein